MPPAPSATSAVPVATVVSTTVQPDSGYAAFALNLKAALEKADFAAAAPLLSSDFSIAVWRSQGNVYHNTADALKGLQQLSAGASIIVDLDRVPVEPIMQSPPDVHILVARWAGDSYAHLVIRQQNGEWKWTGILTGIEYYHSPTAEMLKAEPRAYVAREIMLIGEVANPAREDFGPEPAPLVNDPLTFVLRDASGGAAWIEIARDVLATTNLSPKDLMPGTSLRAIGIVQEDQGRPVLTSDSVQVLNAGEYSTLRGVIADYSASARMFTVEGSTVQVALLETTTQDYANGKPIRAVPLGKGVRVLVFGRPGPGNVLQAEAIYIYL